MRKMATKISAPEECPACGKARGVLLHSPFVGSYNRVPVELADVASFRCEACGEQFYTPEQARELSLRVKLAAREKLDVLSPERIVAIRKKARLSQEALEDLLGLGDKVVTRWETGRVVPTKAADFVLRLLDRRPELIDDLRQIRAETRQKTPSTGL
jgi:HTH-type transcriptional regulator / antitoxin MqsA